MKNEKTDWKKLATNSRIFANGYLFMQKYKIRFHELQFMKSDFIFKLIREDS